MEIIPSIIAGNFDEVREKIARVENLVDWVELDVMDGAFVPNVTWQTPDDLKSLTGQTKLSAHLMTVAPETIAEDWQEVTDRIIVHLEAINDLDGLIERQSPHCPLGVALNLITPVEKVFPYLDQIKWVQLMSIARTGFGDEPFDNRVLTKIEILKNERPEIKLIVDGGINLIVAQELMASGVDALVIGSQIWGAADPAQAIQDFQALS